jgi:hypothetical protein
MIADLHYQYRNLDFQLKTTNIFADGAFEQLQGFDVGYKYNKLGVNYSLEINKLAPPYRYWREYSNHYQWENDLHFSSEFNQSIDVSYQDIHLKMDYNDFRHYVYLAPYIDANSMQNIGIKQFDSTISVFRISLEENIQFYHIGIRSKFVYQTVSHPSIIPLPQWLAKMQFSYTHKFLKVSTFSIGSEAVVHAKYYARAFSPPLQEFYVQTEQKVGEYLYLNAFLRFKLKRLRLYIRYSNIGAYFQDKKYYEVPGYPTYQPGMSFGISWIFYN